jgi:hypothetical protein
MKNKIFVSSSVILFIFFALVNMSAVVNYKLGWGNFILSLLFVVFWGGMVNFTSDSKSIMIYSIALWSVILISSVVSLVASATSIQVGFLMVPVSFLTAPMFGLRMILKSTFINYIFLGLISITFIGVNSYFLSRYLKY